jgi:hypothetical protein
MNNFRGGTVLGRQGWGTSQVKNSPSLNWATQFLMVAYDGAYSPNVSVRTSVTRKRPEHEQTPLSDTIDSVLRHREVGQAKDLSASPHNTELMCHRWDTAYHTESRMSLNQSAYLPLLLVVNVVAGGRRGEIIRENAATVEPTARDHGIFMVLVTICMEETLSPSTQWG